jgi:hypothetical protein
LLVLAREFHSGTWQEAGGLASGLASGLGSETRLLGRSFSIFSPRHFLFFEKKYFQWTYENMNKKEKENGKKARRGGPTSLN